MKIHNIRLGLACNSSSSHSIVFLPGGALDDSQSRDFGWDFFTAGSLDRKMDYFALHVLYALQSSGLDSANAKIIVENLTGKPFEGGKDIDEAYIDHQSVLELPVARATNYHRQKDISGINLEFAKDFKNFLAREDVVVLGGNDNDDNQHPLKDNSAPTPLGMLPRDQHSGNLIARRDGNYWVLFNMATGAKIRLSFTDNAPEYTKSTYPELIDIKITDFCDYGCEWCYQDSTPSGAHANYEILLQMAYNLSALEVFEVALGGGEPTQHPKLKEIVHGFRSQGVVPNITTKNADFVLNPPDWALEDIGAIAYSAPNTASLATLKKMYQRWQSIDSNKLTFQVIDGVATDTLLKKLTDSYLSVTVLGYKEDGRGLVNLKAKNGLAVFNKHRGAWTKLDKPYQMRIDTALVAEYEDYLKSAKVNPLTYHKHEGKFSMYIDAVKGTASAASYGHQQKIPLEFGNYHNQLKDQIPLIFAQF